MKRLIVCCDGTWQGLSSDYPTNVVKIAQAVKPVADDGTVQMLFYDEGVGTGDKADKIFGGAFGWGINKNIQDAYRFLCLNYDEGDEIYLYGFSRGAYTVRSLAGLINCSGLLRRDHIRQVPEAYNLYRQKAKKGETPIAETAKASDFRRNFGDRVPITFLGCWDTVGALGVPDQISWLSLDKFFNDKYKFHDEYLSKIIQHARHAVAIDERRKVFDVTPMKVDQPQRDLKQVWFPGDHGCLGGGTKANVGLSDGALQWMIEESEPRGLEFDTAKILYQEDKKDPSKTVYGIKPDPVIAFDNRVTGIYKLMPRKLREVSENWSDLHESTIKRWVETNTDASAESQETNFKTNLPYNPQKLIAQHGVQLAQARSEYIIAQANETKAPSNSDSPTISPPSLEV